jgi:lipoate-protein ligase A
MLEEKISALKKDIGMIKNNLHDIGSNIATNLKMTNDNLIQNVLLNGRKIKIDEKVNNFPRALDNQMEVENEFREVTSKYIIEILNKLDKKQTNLSE